MDPRIFAFVLALVLLVLALLALLSVRTIASGCCCCCCCESLVRLVNHGILMLYSSASVTSDGMHNLLCLRMVDDNVSRVRGNGNAKSGDAMQHFSSVSTMLKIRGADALVNASSMAVANTFCRSDSLKMEEEDEVEVEVEVGLDGAGSTEEDGGVVAGEDADCWSE